MKKLTLSILSAVFISTASAQNFSGSYDCSGYDSQDGAYSNDTVTLSMVKDHSYPERDLYAYDFRLEDEKGTILYKGEASSSGNSLAIYFANVDKKTEKTRKDHGIGIATVGDIVSRDSTGKFVNKLNFNKFYYEPSYTSDGSETCIIKSETH